MRKKTEEKRQTILDAAKEVFRDSGYETSSMSDIAARAGASKATLYSYFASKEALFMEVIIEAGEIQGEASFKQVLASESLAEGLCRLGEQHVAFISSPEAIALARLAITEGERSPVGREFYQRGPGAILDRMAAHLQGALARGELRGTDPRRMAEHLKALYEAGIMERRLFGGSARLGQQELRERIAGAVEIFLRFYAA